MFHSLGKRAIQALAVKCKNADKKCDWVGTVGMLEEHVAKCEFGVVVHCRYKELGCDAELTLHDKTAHEEDNKFHLHMAINTITELKKEKAKIVLHEGKSMTFKAPNFQTMRKENSRFYSPSFYTSRQGYHAVVGGFANGKRAAKGTHVTLGFKVLPGDNDNRLNWPFRGKVKLTLLNQLENANHRNTSLSISLEERVNADQYKAVHFFISHSALGYDPDKNTQYLKDDTLYFMVSVKVADYNTWLECDKEVL